VPTVIILFAVPGSLFILTKSARGPGHQAGQGYRPDEYWAVLGIGSAAHRYYPDPYFHEHDRPSETSLDIRTQKISSIIPPNLDIFDGGIYFLDGQGKK